MHGAGGWHVGFAILQSWGGIRPPLHCHASPEKENQVNDSSAFLEANRPISMNFVKFVGIKGPLVAPWAGLQRMVHGTQLGHGASLGSAVLLTPCGTSSGSKSGCKAAQAEGHPASDVV